MVPGRQNLSLLTRELRVRFWGAIVRGRGLWGDEDQRELKGVVRVIPKRKIKWRGSS